MVYRIQNNWDFFFAAYEVLKNIPLHVSLPLAAYFSEEGITGTKWSEFLAYKKEFPEPFQIAHVGYRKICSGDISRYYGFEQLFFRRKIYGPGDFRIYSATFSELFYGNLFYRGVTFLGNGGFIWILLSIWFLCTKTYRKQGIVLLAVLAATFLFGDVLLKNLIQRPRPFQDFPTELLITPRKAILFPAAYIFLLCGCVCSVSYPKKLGNRSLCFGCSYRFFQDVFTCPLSYRCIGRRGFRVISW